LPALHPQHWSPPARLGYISFGGSSWITRLLLLWPASLDNGGAGFLVLNELGRIVSVPLVTAPDVNLFHALGGIIQPTL